MHRRQVLILILLYYWPFLPRKWQIHKAAKAYVTEYVKYFCLVWTWNEILHKNKIRYYTCVSNITQCGNSMTFLTFGSFLREINFDRLWICRKSKFWSNENGQIMVVCSTFCNHHTMNSIWFHVKSQRQENCWIFTLCPANTTTTTILNSHSVKIAKTCCHHFVKKIVKSTFSQINRYVNPTM